MSEAHDRTAEFLAQHPRMLGVLFTAFLLLSQAASVAAKNGIKSTSGP